MSWPFDLLSRWRWRRARRAELRWLKAQFASVARLPAGDRARAKRLISAKRDLLAAQGELSACATCAQGRPAPHGTFVGGFCCGGSTAELFTLPEVVALHAAGVRARHLRPAPNRPAGCIFRGERGCTLEPGSRPLRCVVHYCSEAKHELVQRGDHQALAAMVRDLRQQLEEIAPIFSPRAGRVRCAGAVNRVNSMSVS